MNGDSSGISAGNPTGTSSGKTEIKEGKAESKSKSGKSGGGKSGPNVGGGVKLIGQSQQQQREGKQNIQTQNNNGQTHLTSTKAKKQLFHKNDNAANSQNALSENAKEKTSDKGNAPSLPVAETNGGEKTGKGNATEKGTAGNATSGSGNTAQETNSAPEPGKGNPEGKLANSKQGKSHEADPDKTTALSVSFIQILTCSSNKKNIHRIFVKFNCLICIILIKKV